MLEKSDDNQDEWLEKKLIKQMYESNSGSQNHNR